MMLPRAFMALLFGANLATAQMPSSYQELARNGLVSGFGLSSGRPAAMINRIPAIDEPRYVSVEAARLRDDDLCVGVQRHGVWHFAPLFILNMHEIVNHDDGPSIAYCPLAGLSVAIDGRTYISGLLRWDAFVLWDPDTEALILPFDQRTLDGEQHVPLQPLEMLSFAGVRRHFPDARMLSPRSHDGNRSAYGSYPTDGQLGIGHAKPGIRGVFNPRTESVHPKDYVMIAGTADRMLKAYPFSALEAAAGRGQTTVTDSIDGAAISLTWDEGFRHARIVADSDHDIAARAFSYYFALRQHLPDLPVYQAESGDALR